MSNKLGPTLTGVNIPGGTLVGVDGNAYFVMGFVVGKLKRAGNSKEIIDRYTQEAKSGDYDHLLQVSMAYLGEGQKSKLNGKFSDDDDYDDEDSDDDDDFDDDDDSDDDE